MDVNLEDLNEVDYFIKPESPLPLKETKIIDKEINEDVNITDILNAPSLDISLIQASQN